MRQLFLKGVVQACLLQGDRKLVGNIVGDFCISLREALSGAAPQIECADQPSPATVNEEVAAKAPQASEEPVRFFELEEAPGQGTVHDDAEPVQPEVAVVAVNAPAHDEASPLEDNADGIDALDFSVYDRELVDIFDRFIR